MTLLLDKCRFRHFLHHFTHIWPCKCHPSIKPILIHYFYVFEVVWIWTIAQETYSMGTKSARESHFLRGSDFRFHPSSTWGAWVQVSYRHISWLYISAWFSANGYAYLAGEQGDRQLEVVFSRVPWASIFYILLTSDHEHVIRSPNRCAAFQEECYRYKWFDS